MLVRASGSSSGVVGVPHAGRAADGLTELLAPSGALDSGFGPGITPSGMTWATSGSAARAAAWLAVIVAMTALMRWVEEMRWPPAERRRLTTGACCDLISERRLAELAAIVVF